MLRLTVINVYIPNALMSTERTKRVYAFISSDMCVRSFISSDKCVRSFISSDKCGSSITKHINTVQTRVYQ